MSKNEHPKPKNHVTHKTQKKVFDVTRPGQAPASPNSRSVVVTGKPVADDQFVPSAPILRASNPDAQHDLLDAKNRKGLQPLSAPETSDQDVTSSDATPTSTVPTMASAPALSEKDAQAVAQATTPKPAELPKSTVDTNVEEASSSPVLAGPPELAEDVAKAASATPAAADEAVDTPTATPEVASVAATPIEPAEEETPAHFAMEHTVEAAPAPAASTPQANDIPIWEHPDTSQQVENTDHTPSAPRSGKTIEDLLAETGAPSLEPEKTPSMIVSHHKTRHVPWWEPVLIFVLIILVAGVAINFLLDADIIKTSLHIPHTNLF